MTQPRRMRRWLIGLAMIAAVPLLTLAALALYNAAASSRARSEPDASGRVLDVGGRSAFVRVRGSGGPTVVFEAGLGSSIEWWAVQDRVAEHTRTVSYERAGYGWSADANGPRDAATIGRERDALLAAAGVSPPYVWVGESVGALYAQEAARRRPDETAALMLVDPITLSHLEYERELPRAFYQNLINLTPRLQGSRAAAALGLVRALRALPYDTGSPATRRLLVDRYAADATYATMLAEYRAIAASIEQVSAAGAMPDVPLWVVRHAEQAYLDELQFFTMSYDEAVTVERLMRSFDDRTAQASAQGQVLSVERATHALPMAEPERIAEMIVALLGAASAGQ